METHLADSGGMSRTMLAVHTHMAQIRDCKHLDVHLPTFLMRRTQGTHVGAFPHSVNDNCAILIMIEQVDAVISKPVDSNLP